MATSISILTCRVADRVRWLLAIAALAAGCTDATGGGSDAGVHDAGPLPDGAIHDAGSAGITDASGHVPADAATASDGGVSYTTDFDGTEAPISEGGAWTHVGADWTLVDTAGGIAYGTQLGTGGYDDSYAHLSGFPPDQTASAVVHLDPAISRDTTHEVEILLRWADSEHNARGYECNFAWDGGYVQIVRWNGALSSFTYLAGGDKPGGGSVPGGMHEGDVVSAKIVGSVITVYVNGAQVATATDSTWTTGNPGMGFWRGSASGFLLGDYGFSRFTATSVPP